MLYYTTFPTPFWEIILAGNEQGLAHLHMETGEGSRSFSIDPAWVRKDEFFDKARQQVLEYFAGTRSEFTIPLAPKGTDFQQQVWQALRAIPHGQTRSYKEIAEAMGKPKAARAVGTANGKNPIPIIIPCHRVIAAGGKLAGFAHGLGAKQQLLNLEKKQ